MSGEHMDAYIELDPVCGTCGRVDDACELSIVDQQKVYVCPPCIMRHGSHERALREHLTSSQFTQDVVAAVSKATGVPTEELTKDLRDAVNHPSHYGGDVTYEHIKVVAAWWPDQLTGYCLGNATKYMCRAGKKDPDKRAEDLRKAKFYLDFLIKAESR